MSNNKKGKPNDKLTESFAAVLDHLEAQLKNGHFKNLPGSYLNQDHIDTIKEHLGITEPGKEVED